MRFPVLGIETTFVSGSPEVLRVVEEVYGPWAALRREVDLVSTSDATVQIIVDAGVHDGVAAARSPEVAGRDGGVATVGVATVVEDGPLLRIDGPEGSGTADPRALTSRARIAPVVVARPEALVADWLEPLTLFLLGWLDRQPLHAAAVVAPGEDRAGPATGAQHFPRTQRERPGRTGTGLLLSGPSGVGKSTLAYAAWRSGFGLLADEPVYVQLRPRLRVWGRRPRVYLPEAAAAHFPELREREPTHLPTGKTKIVIDAPARALPFVERAGLCLVYRSRGRRPHLEPIPVERAVDEIRSGLDPGYDLFRATIGERVARIAECGAWRLGLAGDPEAALPFLREAALRVRAAG